MGGWSDIRSGSLRIQWILMDGMDGLGWDFTNKMLVILGDLTCCRYTYIGGVKDSGVDCSEEKRSDPLYNTLFGGWMVWIVSWIY